MSSERDKFLTLFSHAIEFHEGNLGQHGQLTVSTMPHTGRAADAKVIVNNSDLIEFGPAGKPTTFQNFQKLHAKFQARASKLHCVDFFVGPFTGRLYAEKAWHAMFALSMFRPADRRHEGTIDLTIYDVPSMKKEPVVALDLIRGIVLIAGTSYAGEIKKSALTYASWKLPEASYLPMHSSVTTDKDGNNVTVFFGLSGTGKTTLSADPNRRLVGDDEHAWGEQGIYNLEGGCYAKAVNLTQANEPDIWDACHSFGTIIENVVADSTTRALDFTDTSITENSRAAYPLSAIKRSWPTGTIVSHPTSIIMLTCDANGVLPPISRLSPYAAAYHFLSGYTAKVAGTESGVKKPVSTFSACYGAPFMPRSPTTYASMLIRLMESSGCGAWLVNTGWIGGPVGVGQRMPLATTRRLVNAITSSSLDYSDVRNDNVFNLDVLDIPASLLNVWSDASAQAEASQVLAKAFVSNFSRFIDKVDPLIVAAGPHHER